MAIKINGQDLQKRYINNQEIVRVYKAGAQVRPETVPPVFDDYLRISKVYQGGSDSSFRIDGGSLSGGGYAVSLEVSTDKEHWTDYTLREHCTIPGTGKIYIRNKSETPTRFNTGRWDYWTLFLSSVSDGYYMGGDISTLLCKYGTTTISDYCFYRFFDRNGQIKSIPRFTAIELAANCYSRMFMGSGIDISDTQTGEFQYEFRLPNVGTGIDNTGGAATDLMFYSVGSVITNPSVNTTYYCNVPTY